MFTFLLKIPPHFNFKLKFNPFYATGLFLCPFQTLENLWFYDVVCRYRKRPMARNGTNVPYHIETTTLDKRL